MLEALNFLNLKFIMIILLLQTISPKNVLLQHLMIDWLAGHWRQKGEMCKDAADLGEARNLFFFTGTGDREKNWIEMMK